VKAASRALDRTVNARVTWSDAIIEPRAAGQGCSLRDAYRPRSSDALAQLLAQHPCRACGRVSAGLGSVWRTEPRSHELGPVLYCTLVHECPCGLSLPVFVVLNDLLRADDHPCPPSAEALARVDQLLPPEDLEQGLVQTRCLLHRGDEAEAVLLAEALAQRHPDRPECWFNAGCARQRLGDDAAAIAHYARALALHPQLEAAWRNRGLLLRRLGRLAEARFCLLRQRQAGGEAAVPPGSEPRLLHETAGAFGPLRVIEDQDLRALYIGEQCQGAVFRHADDDGPRPGPLAHSPFTTGWLVAGSRHPEGRGLMLGLGSGAGAVTLLHNFPRMRLRVVEIDAALIEVALAWFPRLARLRRQGRLELVQADAREVVRRPVGGGEPEYDFALLDVFTGVPEPPPLVAEPGFVAGLCARSRLVMANAILTLGGPAQHAWLALFAAAGRPIAGMIPTGAPEHWSLRPHNWLLSTAPVGEAAASFVPYAGSTGFLAEAIRSDYRSMVARAIRVPRPPGECTAPRPASAADAVPGDAASA
jgi:hypothetical protein